MMLSAKCIAWVSVVKMEVSFERTFLVIFLLNMAVYTILFLFLKPSVKMQRWLG